MSAGTAASGPPSERPGSISTVHRYELPLPLVEVWALISDVSRYRTWWPWLHLFEAAALAEGEQWRCEVQPPVPYPVRFRVAIGQIEAPLLVGAAVSGDVVGDATLTLEDGGAGCIATLRSSLAPGNRALQLVSRFAPPIARFGHDWVLDSGARQFIARAVEPLVGD